MGKVKSKHYHFYLFWVFSLVLCGVFTGGCAALKEGVKGFAGLSTKILEDNRKDALKAEFDYDYDTCYAKTKMALVAIDSYIYAQDLKKRMIAVYVSSVDTTPVGIFFSIVNPSRTQVEVSSPSASAKERLAMRVFNRLSGTIDPEDKPKTKEAKEANPLLGTSP